MRKVLIPTVVALQLAGAATALGAARTITVGDNYFVRASGVPTVTVHKGDSVTWKWQGRKAHNVRVTKGPVRFTSPTQKAGSFKRVMSRTGTYTIICDIHGAKDQQMKLIV